MDLTEKVDEQKHAEKENAYTELAHKCYTVAVQHRFFPFLSKKHSCYRHEISQETGHLILYRMDSSQIAIAVAKRSWIVYPNYWDFMRQFNK